MWPWPAQRNETTKKLNKTYVGKDKDRHSVAWHGRVTTPAHLIRSHYWFVKRHGLSVAKNKASCLLLFDNSLWYRSCFDSCVLGSAYTIGGGYRTENSTLQHSIPLSFEIDLWSDHDPYHSMFLSKDSPQTCRVNVSEKARIERRKLVRYIPQVDASVERCQVNTERKQSSKTPGRQTSCLPLEA